MSSSKLKILIFVGAVAAAVAAPIFAADTKTISSVEVQELDGVTRVVLRGAEDPIYTAFMRQDPPRLIVEMLDVTFSGIASPIAADTALVDEVQLGTFGDEEDAARAFDAAARRLRGDQAHGGQDGRGAIWRLNFPTEQEKAVTAAEDPAEAEAATKASETVVAQRRAAGEPSSPPPSLPPQKKSPNLAMYPKTKASGLHGCVRLVE